MTEATFQPSTAAEVEETLLTEMRAIVGDSAEVLIVELVPMFLEDAPRLLDQLETAVSTQDADQLRESAHTLKGSSGSMGLKTLSSLSYELEMMGRSRQLEPAAKKLSQLQMEYAVVVQVLSRYLP
ncbi:MAG: Hpt domain-containing protein [Anaerolineales bacterium]|nr:Hpt domain-containing protein [Anaerolineales bacterium]